ncbi:unnamed protein product [Parascedosporium putredinis]|uniref:Lethal giant larvae (Lgl)-like C-terminal domain-containing protein n=1 Tax=Parascedosporium putredinis TaxID=1442378 RepID=A0A9P1MG90_9PEZI|nr:unnamed protein product [Parascedosporium putredinis]CAI8003997.1 unnamed protein product [Parascedosporium putredinis]
MVETRNQGELILTGGAEAQKPKRKYENRTILQVAHADGTIRIWDSGHGDDIENDAQLQVDVARAVSRYDSVEISAMSMAPSTGEFAAGTSAGEVVVYRWGPNQAYGRDHAQPHDPNPGGLTDITSRAEPPLKTGLQPYTLYEMAKGPITALNVSDIGFVAVGSQGGFFSILDLRGPVIIFQASLSEFARTEKRSSFLKGLRETSGQQEWPVQIKFGVMTLEGDNYSSIACFVGTNTGKVITFKLLPAGEGYTVKVAGVVDLGSPIVAICPIVADTGKPAVATGPIVAGLRGGQQVNGILVVVTQTEIRVFKPATAKGASKSFDDILCDAAAVTELDYRDTIVTENGYVFGWHGPSELALFHVWGLGDALANSADIIINPELMVPPRPTISNLQWISGTQYVSPTDLDLLIGGPDRPPSKRMLEAAAAEQRAMRLANVSGNAGQGSAAGGSQEGWGEYLTRQLNERTEKLNIMGDNMDKLQDASQGWADDVSKVVKKQQRNMLLGGLKGKFL